MLLEFSNQANLEICQDLMCITPLNGIKVAIKDTRHFVASKTSQNGKLYFQLLTEGMIKLRAKGRIRQLYQEMGLINAKVKDWQVIN